jgi:hypothetical protein
LFGLPTRQILKTMKSLEKHVESRGAQPSMAPRSAALMCVLEPSYREYIVSKKRVGRPFRKGVSGNPAGRPRIGESVAEYIRELGGPDGHLYIDRLHAVATGKHSNPRAMLTAIAVLLERGFGKPPQAIEHSGRIGNNNFEAALLTDDELAIALAISRKATGAPVAELTEIRLLLEEPARRLSESNRTASAQSSPSSPNIATTA